MNKQNLGSTMTLRARPLAALKPNGHTEDDEDSSIKLYEGLEFDSAEAAQSLYTLYGIQNGFTVRIGQLYRSRTDGSVTARRYVCSKEGFQTNMRTGCPAFIKVNKLDYGKWALVTVRKEHNHDLDNSVTQRKATLTPKSVPVVSSRSGVRSFEDDDDPSSGIDLKRLKRELLEPEPVGEPYKDLYFTSATDAYKFYLIYAANMGFKVRIGQLFRSKNRSITSRRFVCSKEGYQHPSRLGCGAFMRIQRHESGSWVVDRFSNDHNHELDSAADPNPSQKSASAPTSLKEEMSSGLECLDLVETNGGLSLVKGEIGGGIESQLYDILLNYFQTRQAEETGFFYALEVDNGRCMSVFWADGRSRFSCAQFGDAIVFDTSYRRGRYTIPFCSFFGFNHHRQPVLLGCALMSDESEESFTWVFQAWVRAMSGRCPVSIIADQDKPIQNSIAQVFPGTHHRFSPSQILAKERENLGLLRSMKEFKDQYETCISHSQTASEFDSQWSSLINDYNLQENTWLKEMYRMRKSWVPFYLRGTFFAGIPVEGSIKSYFETFITPQLPLNEFITRYEKAIEHHREAERNEDFNAYNLQPVLHTRDPLEEQCRKLYTIAMFKIFQKELLESYNYAGIKINIEGAITRYLVQRFGNGDERNTVAFNASNLNVTCSCKMFEFEGILCRHALKVFQITNIREEIPSRYILHRWTKSAKYGNLRDVDSAGRFQDLKALMVWSLREEAHSYVDAGSADIERFKLAFEILQEGRRNVCCKN